MKKIILMGIFLFLLNGCVSDCNEISPVCGKITVQCITTPCDPVEQTFQNICKAKEANAFEIKKGPCEEVTNFEECISAGNPAMESYPRQCRHEDRTFTEQLTLPED
jgi:hypothetical protein